MTEAKRVVCMTEWEISKADGARMVDMRTASVPDEVARVADEMRKPKRPEPYSHKQLRSIYRDGPTSIDESLRITIEADRNRQAEIAAWDAEHASDAPVWVEAPDVYPEDGYYWHRYDAGYVCDVELRKRGTKVPVGFTHIAGPIQLKKPVDP